MSAYEARLAIDPHSALVECARRGIPGPIVAGNHCDCGLAHVVTLAEYEDDEIVEAFATWFHDPEDRCLVDVYELTS